MFMTLFSSFLTKARLYVCNPSNSLRSRQIEANWNLFSTFSASFCLWMIEYRCDLRTRIAERERHTHRDRETSMSARNGVWVNRKLLFEFGQRDIQNKEWIRMTPKENKPDGTRQFSEKKLGPITYHLYALSLLNFLQNYYSSSREFKSFGSI